MKSIIYTSILVGSLSCRQPSTVGETSSNSASDNIVLSEKQLNNIELKVGQIDSVEISQKIQVNGYVDVPPQGRASVTTFKAGYVKEVSLLIGNKVKKGQLLAVLEHPDYVKMQQNYLDLSGRLTFLKSEYDRQKSLFADKITAEKNLLRAESEYNSAEAQFKGLGEELRMLGLSSQQVIDGMISSSIRITSPIEGSVTKMNCAVGKYMPASTEIFEIVNPDHLHMELSVFEQDVMKIKVDQSVLADIPNIGLKAISGEIFLVGQALEEDTRSIRVHAHFENENLDLLPGMYMEAQIITETIRAIALPKQAVITEGEDNYVFIRESGSATKTIFKRKAIKVGIADENWVQILNAGELSDQNVVIQGAYSLSGYQGL